MYVCLRKKKTTAGRSPFKRSGGARTTGFVEGTLPPPSQTSKVASGMLIAIVPSASKIRLGQSCSNISRDGCVYKKPYVVGKTELLLTIHSLSNLTDLRDQRSRNRSPFNSCLGDCTISSCAWFFACSSAIGTLFVVPSSSRSSVSSSSGSWRRLSCCS